MLLGILRSIEGVWLPGRIVDGGVGWGWCEAIELVLRGVCLCLDSRGHPTIAPLKGAVVVPVAGELLVLQSARRARVPLFRHVAVAEVRLRPLRVGFAWAGASGEGGGSGRGTRARTSKFADEALELGNPVPQSRVLIYVRVVPARI